MISPNRYNELKFSRLSFIFHITNWQILIKFWDGSCSSLEAFPPFGRNEGGGSCSEKKAITSQLHNGKKGCTMILCQNQCNFSGGNNGKKISSTFFFFISSKYHKFWLSYWYGYFYVLAIFWCQNWGHFHQLTLVECDKYLLRSTTLPTL